MPPSKNGIVENFEHLIETLKLPDPDDRHVLAAAIASQANTIVTFNIKDFPRTGSIQAMHPDDFLAAQYALDPQATLNAIALLRRRLRKPTKSALQLIATCDQLGLRKFCKILHKSIDQI